MFCKCHIGALWGRFLHLVEFTVVIHFLARVRYTSDKSIARRVICLRTKVLPTNSKVYGPRRFFKLKYIINLIASYAIWWWNMVSYIKGGMQAKGIWKQDPAANIWTQRDENWEWRRLHNEELHSLYRSPNIVRVIKSRRQMGRSCSKNERRKQCFHNFNRYT